MTKRRRRSTDRHRLAVVFLALLAIAALVIPAASYTTAELRRSGSITVAGDPDGLLGLGTADYVCEAGTEQRLVDITNSFDRQITLTVTLVSTETATFTDGSDEATRTLDPDETSPFDVDVNGTSGESVAFSADATGSGFSVSTTERSVSIKECGT
ncbi:hypothetical protein [Halalkalicoccus salilacus]|uniref:hypothetical protein n=1 Tax=Halalkalicoccus salilacus TaxID=3117459 RepID=UPI00300E9DCF